MWHGPYCGGTEAVIPRARAGPATTWDTNCRISYLMSPLCLGPDDADDPDDADNADDAEYADDADADADKLVQ